MFPIPSVTCGRSLFSQTEAKPVGFPSQGMPHGMVFPLWTFSFSRPCFVGRTELFRTHSPHPTPPQFWASHREIDVNRVSANGHVRIVCKLHVGSGQAGWSSLLSSLSCPAKNVKSKELLERF